MAARWVFVRHAESVANAEGWLAGHLDPPLTERGRAQASALRPQLDLRGVTRLWCSDLLRARQTAELAVPGATFETTPRIRERHLGAWEGCTRDSLRASGAWEVLLDFDGSPPGGESLRACARRMISWMGSVDALESTLVVSHGALLRAFLGVLDGLALHEIGTWNLTNAEVHTRMIGPADLETAVQMLGG